MPFLFFCVFADVTVVDLCGYGMGSIGYIHACVYSCVYDYVCVPVRVCCSWICTKAIH